MVCRRCRCDANKCANHAKVLLARARALRPCLSTTAGGPCRSPTQVGEAVRTAIGKPIEDTRVKRGTTRPGTRGGRFYFNVTGMDFMPLCSELTHMLYVAD